jgi:hypothetical protein
MAPTEQAPARNVKPIASPQNELPLVPFAVATVCRQQVVRGPGATNFSQLAQFSHLVWSGRT